MTDTGIREKVARAMQEGAANTGASHFFELDDFKVLADSALLAIGYQEMREVMKTALCVLSATRVGYASNVDIDIATEGLRSALEKSK